jgi:eukaryotic-like serine/threonine-protein kinase
MPQRLDSTFTLASEHGSSAGHPMPSEPGTAGTVDALPIRDPTRYQLIEEHARGGQGRVWRAHDRQLGRVVALKELQPNDEAAAARFVREALTTARLEHPGIVPVHEAGRWESGEPFYVMKLVSGRTLGDVVRETTSLGERLALLPSLIACSDAIGYAHAQGVVHRDLKPSNVIIGDHGETVVVDWGVAEALHARDAVSAGAVVGTPAFMAPEQARGDPVDERADVYALGALVYYVLAGRAPYSGESPSHTLAQVRASAPPRLGQVAPGVPADLAAIVDRAMARELEDRYATARDLAADFRRFQAGQVVSTHHYSVTERVGRWVHRHRGLTLASAAFALLAALGAGAFLVREGRLRRAAEDRTVTLLETEGRAELAAGRPFHAAPYLAEALSRRPASLALRSLLTQAIAPMASLERTLLVSDASDVWNVAFSPDGKRLVTGSGGGTGTVWSADGTQVAAHHMDGYWHATAFSPDGHLVAMSGIHAVDVFRADSGELVSTFDAGAPAQVAFTPDGKRIIVGGDAGDLRLYDAETGAALAQGQRNGDRIVDMAFSPDGMRLAAVSRAEVSIWDVARFEPVTSFGDPDNPLVAVAYTHDGRILITAESRRYLRVRRADTGAVLSTILMSETARTPRLFVLPGDHVVVTCSADGLVRSWDLASGAVLDAFEAEPLGNILTAALSPDGEELVTGGAAGSVHVWRLARGRSWRLLDHPADDGDYGDAAHSKGGTRIVTGDTHHMVGEWNAASGEPLRSFNVHADAQRVIPVLGGARVAVLPWEPSELPAHVWDLATGASTATLPSPRSRLAMGRASPDGRTVATVGYDGAVRLFDAESGAPLAVFALDTVRLTAVAFRPDGGELAIGNERGTLYFLDRASGRLLRTVAAHPSQIHDIDYRADGARLVTAGRNDHTARVWDTTTGRLELTLSGHSDRLTHAAFNPDGTLIATVGADNVANLWDATTGELIRVIPGPGQVAKFSPDGTELFTIGDCGYTVFWKLALDTRSPGELAAYVAEHSPWRLVDGRLQLRVPADAR